MSVQLNELGYSDCDMDDEMRQTIMDVEEYQKRLRFVDGEFARQRRFIKGEGSKERLHYQQIQARKDIVADMEGTSFLERCEHLLQVISPVIISICRVISTLIIAILNIGIVREHISAATLEKMVGVYSRTKRFC